MAAVYDIAAFRPVAEGQPASQVLADIGYGGAVVVGEAKLAQRFSIKFLQRRGSVPYDSSEGTEFISDVQRGALTELDVLACFSKAIIQMTPSLLREEDSGMPDGERFAGAGLTKIVIGERELAIEVTVVSRTGGTGFVTLPVSIEVE